MIRGTGQSWLWATRGATLASLALIYGGMFFAMWQGGDAGEAALGALLLALFPCLPYLLILTRSFRPHPRNALVAARWTGLTVGVPLLFPVGFGVMRLVTGGGAPTLWAVAGLVLLLGTQMTLVISAGKALQQMPAEEASVSRVGKFLATAGVVVYFTAVLLVLAAALPGLVSSRAAANAAMAAGALRTINTAAATYAQTYKNGFPSDLRVLGSPPAGSAPGCNTADLMDPYMARGEKNGYRFEYRPGPRRETPAENCTGPGVDSYVVIARPIRYEQTGRRSFFTDQDGVIRFTVEDREPTWQDAVVQ